MTIISVSGNYTKIILEKSLFFNLLSKVSSTKSELYCKSLYFDYNSILEVKTSTKMTEGKKKQWAKPESSGFLCFMALVPH